MPNPGTISYQNIKVGHEIYRATAPVIISASRVTDIPAFKGDWFFDRLKKGYVERRNPFSGKNYYISLQNASVFIFWSKNPGPFISKLAKFKQDFYFQFTLNNYDLSGLEPNVPKVKERIDTFKTLVDTYGKERILWRFDPIMITPNMPLNNLLDRISFVASQLKGYTDRQTFSFLTMKGYRAARQRLSKVYNVSLDDVNKFIPSENDQGKVLQFLSQLQVNWQKSNPDFTVQACALPEDYSSYGIAPSRCVDDQLLRKLFPQNQRLVEFLGDKKDKIKDDPSQRKNCHCIPSKDIGENSTCGHGCLYCYANK